MNTFEDYDLSFLGEQVHAAATVQSGFRGGVIALTETRLVFVPKKKGSEFIELEFSRDAIASATLSRNIGGRQLTIEYDGSWSFFVGHRRELEPFLEPLMQSAAANNEKGPAEAAMYAEHDTTIIDESALLTAKASGGFRSGVIVLTENRLVYLRKKKGVTYIDRDTDRTAISEFETKPFLNNVDIRFIDRRDLVIYTPKDDDLKPFVDPLRASADANEAKRKEELHEAEQRAREETAKREVENRAREKQTKKNAPRLKQMNWKQIVGEPVLLTAKASAGFGSGVIVLTENRLVYLRRKKGETYIDRDTDRATISEFETKPFLNSVDLRFKDRGDPVIYTPKDDDLKPFVDPLRASADANQATVDADREARLADMICSARGRNGQVHLFEDRVLITRQGFVSAFSFGFRGDKEILIQEITSIGWKEPGFTTGYIHFGYRGGQMPVRTSVFADDSIVNNEDAVIFTEEHQPDFERLKKLLEERRAEINRPQVITAVAEGPSPMDELKKLAELKEMGIVTEDEFEQKKKQLLDL